MTDCSNFHNKPVKAKSYQLLVVSPERAEKNAIDKTKYVEAKDGSFLRLGAAYCGVHNKDIVRKDRAISVAMVDDLGGPETGLALDYAKARYEKTIDEVAARRAADEARWAQHRQDDHANTTFSARRVDERGNVEWLIEGTNPNVREGEPFPMTRVEVSKDGGVLWVTTSDYMNSGPGRGNPSWTAAYIDTLQKAAEVQAAGVPKE